MSEAFVKANSKNPSAAPGTSRKNVGRSPPFGGLGLVSAIARGRRWLGEIISGAVTDAKQLAKREPCTVRQVNLTLSFAFLAPNWSRQLSKGASDLPLSISSRWS